MAVTSKRTWTSGGKTVTKYWVRYRDAKGKQRSRNFDTKKAADVFKLKVEVEISAGTHTTDATSLTIKQAGDNWIKTCEANDLERSSVRPYRNHLDLHIVPLIGATKLSRLTTPDIEQFKDDLLRTRSRPMVKKVLSSLKMLISDAQRLGRVAQNVALSVKLVDRGRDREKVEIPTKAEMMHILAEADAAGAYAKTLFTTAALSGLRSSELRGLTWDAVDLKKGTITVRQRADQWGTIDAPKSEAGRREVTVSQMLVARLREWKLACPKGTLNLVFPNGEGRVENHSNIVNRLYNPLQISIDLIDRSGDVDKVDDETTVCWIRARYGFHSLRHFYASLIIEQGFTPKRVQTLMGHSTIQMTMDTYGHLFTDHEADQIHLRAIDAGLLKAAETLEK